MTDDIRTLKMYMEPITAYAGVDFDNGQTIPNTGTFSLTSPTRLPLQVMITMVEFLLPHTMSNA